MRCMKLAKHTYKLRQTKGYGVHYVKNVRAAEQVFENGDMVFYKREGKECWLRPGKVIFQDGKVVFVRHGGVFVRVLPNRLCKVNTYFADNATKDDKQESYDSNDTSEPKSDQTKSATVITETK